MTNKPHTDPIDELFYRTLRGKTVSPEQANILEWAEEQLKPAFRTLLHDRELRAMVYQTELLRGAQERFGRVDFDVALWELQPRGPIAALNKKDGAAMTTSSNVPDEELNTEDEFYGQLDNIMMWCFTLGFNAARREYGEQYKSATEAEPFYEDNLDSWIQDILTSYEELKKAAQQQFLSELMEHKVELVIPGWTSIRRGTGGGVDDTVGVIPASVIQHKLDEISKGGK